MTISVETPVIDFAFGLSDEPRPATAGVEVFDKNFGIKPFSVLGPDGMGLELGDDLLGQQFHNGKILETARNARTAKETKPPCANEDKSSSLGIFAQGGYLAGTGGDDEVYPRKIFRIFVDISNERTGMNRIILIGNGFDLAHNLPTSYKDFINHYWEQWGQYLLGVYSSEKLTDGLCSISQTEEPESWHDIFHTRYFPTGIEISPSDAIKEVRTNSNRFLIDATPFFQHINQSFETKNWVDIEGEYYFWLKRIFREADCGYDGAKSLNKELDEIKRLLIEYLDGIQKDQIKPDLVKECIRKAIHGPCEAQDISIDGQPAFEDFAKKRLVFLQTHPKEEIEIFLNKFGESYFSDHSDIDEYNKQIPNTKYSVGIGGYSIAAQKHVDYSKHIRNIYKCRTIVPDVFLLPDQILLLNFNYTTTADMYLYKNSGFEVNHIHGKLGDNLNHIIFGYGDEMDDDYKTISKLNDNDYLTNIKSIRYLETDKYRQLLRFINSDYYQIYIMGHSCGNSDRTLLNTLFEHPKCVSIKPFYYQWQDEQGEWRDNYIEIIQNISRNFNSMQTMRDRVVNKEFCRPLVPKDN